MSFFLSIPAVTSLVGGLCTICLKYSDSFLFISSLNSICWMPSNPQTALGIQEWKDNTCSERALSVGEGKQENRKSVKKIWLSVETSALETQRKKGFISYHWIYRFYANITPQARKILSSCLLTPLPTSALTMDFLKGNFDQTSPQRWPTTFPSHTD